MNQTTSSPNPLANFRNAIAQHDEKKLAYVSAFDLSPRLTWSGWTRDQLRDAPDPPGLPCPLDDLRDLTQLPEETLGWLYGICGTKLRETQKKPALSSHLKRLRGAIQLYFTLILHRDIPVLDRPPQGLRQEGPFCFFHLLRAWAQAAGKPNGEKELLKILLTFTPNQNGRPTLSILQDTREDLFRPGGLIPDQDRQLLRDCLYAAAQAAPDWDTELRRRYFTRFGAGPETLSRLLDQLKDPVPPHLEPEYDHLVTLSRYWPALYPQGVKDSYRGKVFFVVFLFSLLAAALGTDQKNPSPAPPIRDTMQTKFFSALSRANAALVPLLARQIRMEHWDEEILCPHAPSPDGWTWSESDVASARQTHVIRQQLATLCGQGRDVFRQTWSLNGTPRARERAQAAQALLQLTLKVVEGHAMLPQESSDRREVDEILSGLLSCYRDPALRDYLIRLQNPGWAQLEGLAAQTGMEALAQTMAQISGVSQDYVRVLRLAQELSGLSPDEKLELASWADDAERRLQLCQESLNAIAARGCVSPAPSLSPSHPADLCPVWDLQPDHDYMRPYVSSTFDSAQGFGAAETQLQLASILLRSGRVVLTPPQFADNPNLLSLALNSPAFLELLRCGSVTLSLFRTYPSLRDYTIYTLGDDSFRFSGYRMFQNGPEVEHRYLRFCMASYLCADDEAGRMAALRKAPFAYWEALSQYGDAIRLVDQVLEQQRCAGPFRNLKQLFHQSTGWRKDCPRPGLLARIGSYLQKIPGHPELTQLHQYLVKTLTADTTRSVIYKALDQLSQQEGIQPAAQAYRTIADWMYFEENSTCITPFKEHRVEQEYRDLLPPNHQGEDLSFQISYTQSAPNAGASLLELRDLVQFVRESRRWVAANPNAVSAAAILWGTLDHDRSVQITRSQQGVCYLERLALRPDGGAGGPVLQERDTQGTFTQLEHRE